MVNPNSIEVVRNIEAFSIKDCAVVVMATGKKARMLQELRSELAVIDTASIYHHFWGNLLQPSFDEREYNNDFATWARHGIHDVVLAERLAMLSPISYDSLDLLRQGIIELIDQRLDEVEHLYWSRATTQFEFMRSQIVVFDTTQRLQEPQDLIAVVGELSTSSIFYHFIDARRRTSERRDDFSDWLAAFGDEFSPLRDQLAEVDPYFGSLRELRQQLSDLFASYFRAVLQ